MSFLALRPGSVIVGLLLGLVLVGSSSCSRDTGDGLEKHPVSGTVYVNGAPVPLVVVQFHNADASVTGYAGIPVGVTDEQGVFALSTTGDKDGAVSGDFIVTFMWLTENSPIATDRFQGQYADPKRSKFRATVEEGPNDIDPFRLEFDESKASQRPTSTVDPNH